MAVKAKQSTNGTADAALVQISKIAEETILVPIIGDSPLIMHAFSAKAKRQMLDAMQGRRAPKQAKDPEAEYESAFYRLKAKRGRVAASKARAKYGLPADAFKQATVGAARFYGKAVTMTALKQFIFIHGEAGDDGRALVPIIGEPEMREDVVRVGQGTDLRYRPEFWPWEATLTVTYFSQAITHDSVISLIGAGGVAVGVGEWRPEKNGTFGRYRINMDKPIQVLR